MQVACCSVLQHPWCDLKKNHTHLNARWGFPISPMLLNGHIYYFPLAGAVKSERDFFA